MRLFFINWVGKELGMIDIVKELQKRHDVVYWTGPDIAQEANPADFPKTIFHDHYAALDGLPADGATERIDPPSEALLKKLLDAESVIMTMMNKRFEHISVSERKHRYYHYVGYWDWALKHYKPDAIVFPVAPHAYYDYVIYALAHLYGIKTIVFELTRVNERSFMIGDIAEGSLAMRREVERNRGKKFALADLPKDVRAYYEKQIHPELRPVPLDVIQLTHKYSGINKLMIRLRAVLRSLADRSFFPKLAGFLSRQFGDSPEKEYRRAQRTVDLSKKFIYAPLHYQPECTTSPLGGVFVDQQLLIEYLSATVPDDVLIYVKEHPLQWKPRGPIFFSYRYKGYYEHIAKLRNVVVVPSAWDTFKLIDAALGVGIVGGTAGWEALLRGKPCITFGYAWYRNCGGVYKVHDAESCGKAVGEVVRGVSVSQEQMLNYLFSFGNVAVNGYRENYCRDVSSVSLAESVAAQVRAIEHALNDHEF